VLVWVVVVVPVPLGAAAAPAIPATAPADASAPVMIAALTAFEGFIGLRTSWGSFGGTTTILRSRCKELARHG
jgi:hypothetical protein